MSDLKNLKVRVRPAEPSDAYLICSERNKVCVSYLHDPHMYSEYDTKKWLENLPKTSKRLIIEEPLGKYDVFIHNIPVGIIRIDNIDYQNNNCQIGLDIFEKYQGKGLAASIYENLFEYLFNNLNMNMVYLEVLGTNDRARHIYEKLGMSLVGYYPDKVFRDGEYQDSYIFAILREYYKNV